MASRANPPKLVVVYPAPSSSAGLGPHLADWPAVTVAVEPSVAAYLVETGAFTYDPPPEESPITAETPLTED